MITNRTTEVANALLAKIKSKEVAVFINNGAAKTCGVNTDLFNKALEAKGQIFMGVYNAYVTREWLEADLDYCGIN